MNPLDYISRKFLLTLLANLVVSFVAIWLAIENGKIDWAALGVAYGAVNGPYIAGNVAEKKVQNGKSS